MLMLLARNQDGKLKMLLKDNEKYFLYLYFIFFKNFKCLILTDQ